MAQRQRNDATNTVETFDSEPNRERQLSTRIARCLTDAAIDATYITIGFGLLALQQAQVQRREFERLRRG